MSSKVLIGIAGLALAGSAMAGTISGSGGVIPASGTGGGSTWPALPPNPAVSSAVDQIGVLSVKSLTLHNLNHTWAGDLFVVLTTPDNTRVNIFHRPGSTGTSVGASGNFVGGDYTFVDSGAAAPLPVISDPGTYTAGTYGQTFNVWVSGTSGIFNMDLSSIGAQGPGTWTVTIYDFAGGDVGFYDGWTLDVNFVPAPGAAAMLGLAGLAGLRRRR